ncbi:ribosomal protein L1p/L10e family-domain-containing protein [Salix suchowensis]|nr:ribosomal protein L1p/L10e family-domain-containing protein [Salix suchowensis]
MVAITSSAPRRGRYGSQRAQSRTRGGEMVAEGKSWTDWRRNVQCCHPGSAPCEHCPQGANEIFASSSPEANSKSLTFDKMAQDELIDSHVSLVQCTRAVDALVAHESKAEEARNENELLPGKEQNVWLVVTINQSRRPVPEAHSGPRQHQNRTTRRDQRYQRWWDNIQSLHIKTNSSVSLPIWSCSLDDESGGRWDGLIADAEALSEGEVDGSEDGGSDAEVAEEVQDKGKKGKKRVAAEVVDTRRRKRKGRRVKASLRHPLRKLSRKARRPRQPIKLLLVPQSHLLPVATPKKQTARIITSERPTKSSKPAKDKVAEPAPTPLTSNANSVKPNRNPKNHPNRPRRPLLPSHQSRLQ